MSRTFGRTSPAFSHPDRELKLRTRRTVRLLLGIVAMLAVATLLAGIRW
jgi:hypothetical protein